MRITEIFLRTDGAERIIYRRSSDLDSDTCAERFYLPASRPQYQAVIHVEFSSESE